MADKAKKTDAQIVAQLRRSRNPKTAKELGGPDAGVTAARLRAMGDQGVIVVGTRQTGTAGRPAVLFHLNETELTRGGGMSEQAASQESADQLNGEVPARPE